MKTRPGGYGIPFSLLLVAVLSPAVQAAMGPSLKRFAADSQRTVDVIVLLDAPAQPLPAFAIGQRISYSTNRHELQQANESEAAAFLTRASERGLVLGNLRSYWLAPFVAASVAVRDLPDLERLPGVAAIIEDAPIEPVEPRGVQTFAAAADATASGQVAIGAPEAWRRGITGKGTLVASIDTGVDGLHPALAARYRGLHAAAVSTWLDPAGQTFPNDPSGHGTHTMGTVLGRDGSDTVGIAPDAEWIAAGVVDRGKTFGETIQDLLTAFQWLADPDGNPATHSDLPDVVLNSWGIPQGILPACDNTFWQVVDNLEALGVVVIFAAGNEGPLPSTLRLPADRGDVPLKCFSVGAVDGADPAFATPLFSSRGPATCNAGIIKPELVAPGVNIRSCKPGGGYQILSGTSMAAPHVAGAVALLRQANPEATPEQIKQALVESAYDIGDPGPDFTTGYGLLNISGALDHLPPRRALTWEWSVPVLKDSAEWAASYTGADLNLGLRNRGCALEQVEIDLDPLDASDLLAQGAHTNLDYLPGDDGEADLVLTFSQLGARQRGDRVWVRARIRAASPVLDTTVVFGLPVGEPWPLEALAQSAGQITGVASNYARFDAEFAQSLGVTDPRFAYGDQVIPFAGGLRVLTSTSERSSFGESNAFEPAPDGLVIPGEGGILSTAAFRDTRRSDPLGVELQQTVRRPDPGPGAYLLYDYSWRRLWQTSPVEPLQFGAWMHWDLAGTEYLVGIDEPNATVVTNGTIFVGALLLGSEASTLLQPFDSMAAQLPGSAGGQATATTFAESYFQTLTAAPAPGASGRFAVALVAAPTEADWEAAAERARQQFAALSAGTRDERPTAFALLGNYPNPFNPATKVRYALDRDAEVRVDVFNVLGRHVRTLRNSWQAAGTYEVLFDGRGDRGEPLASGVYFLRISAGEAVRTARMTLLR